MRLQPSHSIALCVDIQERLFPHIDRHDAMLQRAITLVKGLAILHVPIVVSEQYTKGLGKTVAPLAELLSDAPTLEKMTFSCCGDPGLEGNILGSGRHTVIVFGIEAHVCVLQTVLDLRAQGRHAVVVEDSVSSRNAHDKSIAIERMRQAGAIITTTESLLFELLERAGTDTFKQISALVK